MLPKALRLKEPLVRHNVEPLALEHHQFVEDLTLINLLRRKLFGFEVQQLTRISKRISLTYETEPSMTVDGLWGAAIKPCAALFAPVI